jgi:hypothetical protein
LFESFEAGRNRYLLDIMVAEEVIALLPVARSTLIVMVENNLPGSVE